VKDSIELLQDDLEEIENNEPNSVFFFSSYYFVYHDMEVG
jgi:hypothetical protein